jgi:hypothetical protein
MSHLNYIDKENQPSKEDIDKYRRERDLISKSKPEESKPLHSDKHSGKR